MKLEKRSNPSSNSGEACISEARKTISPERPTTSLASSRRRLETSAAESARDHQARATIADAACVRSTADNQDLMNRFPANKVELEGARREIERERAESVDERRRRQQDVDRNQATIQKLNATVAHYAASDQAYEDWYGQGQISIGRQATSGLQATIDVGETDETIDGTTVQVAAKHVRKETIAVPRAARTGKGRKVQAAVKLAGKTIAVAQTTAWARTARAPPSPCRT